MHQILEEKRFGIVAAYRRHKVSRLDVFGSATRGTDFDVETSDADSLVDFDKSIWNDILEIETEVNHLAAALKRSTPLPSDDQETWERVQMLGSGAEKVYTGCERVMSRIAALVDSAKAAGGEGWHTILLLQMARPFPDVRDAVLSTDTTFCSIDCGASDTGRGIPTASTLIRSLSTNEPRKRTKPFITSNRMSPASRRSARSRALMN